MERPLIIAEIGCNHRGEPETARKMVRIAALECGVDVVKFQKRNPKECLTPAQYAAPHPVPANAYGATYGEHREALELDLSEHRRLKELCEECGVVYSTSVWDMTSAREITSLGPQMIKVPSACNTHLEMIRYLCDAFGGELHISLGMTTRAEEESLISLLEKRERLRDTVLYACVSGYPVDYEDLYLLEVDRLLGEYGGHCKGIGYSGHHLGIAVDIAAMTLGARWIERHFTLDRTWKGTDHAASLEPDEMRRLVRDIHNVAKALQRKKTDLLPVEIPQREKLKQFRLLYG
ncbi:MAG TPA: N-acetylneuraminate synthase family protein [Limnochordia bacterium]|nr:N-acetylneuraminate synthase family protein [Limnochordia bacterium]